MNKKLFEEYRNTCFNLKSQHACFLEHFEDDDIIKLLKEQARVANVIIFDVPNGRRNKKIQTF